MTLIPNDDGEVNCFAKLRELKSHKCNVENCSRPCTTITKGSTSDNFWCNHHFKQAIKEGKIKKTGYNFSLYPIARLLFNLGIVK